MTRKQRLQQVLCTFAAVLLLSVQNVWPACPVQCDPECYNWRAGEPPVACIVRCCHPEIWQTSPCSPCMDPPSITFCQQATNPTKPDGSPLSTAEDWAEYFDICPREREGQTDAIADLDDMRRVWWTPGENCTTPCQAHYEAWQSGGDNHWT